MWYNVLLHADLTLASSDACLVIASEVMSNSEADARINSKEACRRSTVAANSSFVYWHPSPPYPSKQAHDARQVAIGSSARHSVEFNETPEAEAKYSQAPLVSPPQLLGQALAGVSHTVSGQLLYWQSELIKHEDPEKHGVQEPPQSTSVSSSSCTMEGGVRYLCVAFLVCRRSSTLNRLLNHFNGRLM